MFCSLPATGIVATSFSADISSILIPSFRFSGATP